MPAAQAEPSAVTYPAARAVLPGSRPPVSRASPTRSAVTRACGWCPAFCTCPSLLQGGAESQTQAGPSRLRYSWPALLFVQGRTLSVSHKGIMPQLILIPAHAHNHCGSVQVLNWIMTDESTFSLILPVWAPVVPWNDACCVDLLQCSGNVLLSGICVVLGEVRAG
jgi:hypothetical protein